MTRLYSIIFHKNRVCLQQHFAIWGFFFNRGANIYFFSVIQQIHIMYFMFPRCIGGRGMMFNILTHTKLESRKLEISLSSRKQITFLNNLYYTYYPNDTYNSLLYSSDYEFHYDFYIITCMHRSSTKNCNV